MSIPWRGCPNQYVVQVASVVATFLSPVVIVYLSKKINSVAQRIRGEAKLHLRCSSEGSHDNELCDAFTEKPACAQDLNRNEDKSGQEVHQNEPPQDVNLNQSEVDQPVEYCACDSSADSICRSVKSLHEGRESGDCRQFAQMEQPHSERFQTVHVNTERMDYLNDSLAVLKSDRGHNCNLGEQTRDHGVRDSDMSPTEQGCRQNDSTWEPRSPARARGSPISEETPALENTKEIRFSVEATMNPRDPSTDQEGPWSETRPTGHGSCPGGATNRTGAENPPVVCSHTSRDHTNSPRNQMRSSRNRTNVEKAIETGEGTKLENQSQGQEDLRAELDASAELEEHAVHAAQESTQRHHLQEDAKQPDAGRTSLEESVAEPTPKSNPALSRRDRLEDHPREKEAPLFDLVLHEYCSEPHRVHSWSSSDSFSTANCSAASSTVNFKNSARHSLPAVGQQPPDPEAEQGGRPHDSDSDPTDPQDQRPERHREHQAHQKNQGSGHREKPASPPIFELVSPPHLFLRNHARQTKRSEEARAHTSTSDDDDVSGLHGGSHEEEDETIDLSEWLSSTLKSWLPDFSNREEPSTGATSAAEQRAQCPESNSSDFQRFDLRNVVAPDQQNSQRCFMSGTKACPHSCVSSLCNFRRTLESWKKELLAMHAALDVSSTVVSQKHCMYCDEDYQSQGIHQNCYTMHIAQEFWRTVLQFKRSHLESSDCPLTGQPNSGKGKEDENEDEEQCSLGHRHSCSSDYSGCSQHQNSPVDDVHEAPCVHVLLDDVDLLLKKLESLKQSSSLRKSPRGQTKSVSNTIMSERAEQGPDQPDLPCCHKSSTSDSPITCRNGSTGVATKESLHGDQTTTDEYGSEGKSSASMISPSPSISLAGELGDLEELTEDERHTEDDDDSNGEVEEGACTPTDLVVTVETTRLSAKDVAMPRAKSPHVSSQSKVCEQSSRLIPAAEEEQGDNSEIDDSTEIEDEDRTGDQRSQKPKGNEYAPPTECPENASEVYSDIGISVVKQEVPRPQARSVHVPSDSRPLEMSSRPISLAEELENLEESTGLISNGHKHCAYDQSCQKPTKLERTPAAECTYSVADATSATKSPRMNQEVPIPQASSFQVLPRSRLLKLSSCLSSLAEERSDLEQLTDSILNTDEHSVDDHSSHKPKEFENAPTEYPQFESEANSARESPLKKQEHPMPSSRSSQVPSDSTHLQLPKCYISSANKLGYLEARTDAIRKGNEYGADDQNSPNPRELESAPTEFQNIASSGTESPQKNQEILTPGARSSQVVSSDSTIPQLATVSEHPDKTTTQRFRSRSEELTMSKTRSLGKFALRYLDHIEQKIEADDLNSSIPETASAKPTHGGDSPKPMPRAVRKSGFTTLQRQFNEEDPTFNIKQIDTHTFPQDLQAQQPSDTSVDGGARFSYGKQERGPCSTEGTQPHGSPVPTENVRTEHGGAEPVVIGTFHDIISQLSKLQLSHPVPATDDLGETDAPQVDQRDKSGTKSVKFDTSAVRKSHSETNTCPRNMNSPPLQPAVLSTSSCLSLTTSGEDVRSGDMDSGVTQAFDQLDKVVDDLLKLMNVQPQS